MAVKNFEKTIEGLKVSVTQHPGLLLNQLHIDIVKLLGVPLATLLFSAMSQGANIKIRDLLDRELDFPKAIAELCSRLDAVEFESLVMRIFTFTQVNQKPLTDSDIFNDVFAGNLLLMYKIIAYTLEVNLGDFFAVVGTGIKRKEPLPTKKVKS